MKRTLLALSFSLLSACSIFRLAETPPAPKLPTAIGFKVAPAAPTPCIDTLAAAQYGAELKALPNHIAISGFAKTFGDFFPVAKKELDRGRQYIRVDMMWSDSHSFGDKDIPFLKKEGKRYEILCAAYPDRKIELATFTEHNLQNPDKYHDILQAAAPHCRIVNTPWKGALSKAYKNEIHGDHAKPGKPYNYSFDGTNSVDADVESYKAKYSDAELFCMWHPRLNLKWSMKDSANRDKRIKESKDRRPNKALLESLVYLFNNKGSTSIPKGWLPKSHSERHEKSDAKGDKFLLISPIKQANKKGKVKPIQLKAAGKKAASLPYYGPFDGGGYRYYSTLLGYQISEKCRALSGASLCEVFIGKKKYGTINPAFRDGSYR